MSENIEGMEPIAESKTPDRASTGPVSPPGTQQEPEVPLSDFYADAPRESQSSVALDELFPESTPERTGEKKVEPEPEVTS